MQLEVLAGNHSLVTTVVENGMRFHVDLATVYVFLHCNVMEKSIKVINACHYYDIHRCRRVVIIGCIVGYNVTGGIECMVSNFLNQQYIDQTQWALRESYKVKVIVVLKKLSWRFRGADHVEQKATINTFFWGRGGG